MKLSEKSVLHVLACIIGNLVLELPKEDLEKINEMIKENAKRKEKEQ